MSKPMTCLICNLTWKLGKTTISMHTGTQVDPLLCHSIRAKRGTPVSCWSSPLCHSTRPSPSHLQNHHERHLPPERWCCGRLLAPTKASLWWGESFFPCLPTGSSRYELIDRNIGSLGGRLLVLQQIRRSGSPCPRLPCTASSPCILERNHLTCCLFLLPRCPLTEEASKKVTPYEVLSDSVS